MCRSMLWLVLLFPCSPALAFAQDQFSGGRRLCSRRQAGKAGRHLHCGKLPGYLRVKGPLQAYAFQTSRPACYFYSRVFMGGTYDGRQAEIYSAGLAIRPKKGFVSGFKRSSFPERPAMIQHPN
jgi:hypothetical protein